MTKKCLDTFHYSLKVINPKKKSLYSLHSLPNATKFETVLHVKDAIKEFLNGEIQEIGYISPGHGAKGKHNSLVNEEDLKSMYDEYQGRRGVNGLLLWCYRAVDDSSDTQESQSISAPRKRSSSNTKEENPPSKCAKKMQQIEEIVDKLKEKHLSRYSLEQYNCWTHTIDMGKHDSYDNPPDLPFFVGRKSARNSTAGSTSVLASATLPQSTPTPQPQSPGKRIRYRSECMDQLTKWHSLMEKGIITQEQYQGFVGTILNDIKKL